jgi:hypothetical protein
MANRSYMVAVSCPQEGRFAVVTDVGCGMRWTWRCRRRTALTRTAKSCGPDASTLASSRRENFPPVTVTKKPDHRGELEVSRKPLRREGRTASAEPVCSCALCFVHFARETAGAARTRLSLRPLTTGGATFPLKTRAKCAARSRSCVLDHRHCLRQTRSVCARERKRRSNPFPFHMRLHGLLRFARNDACFFAYPAHAGYPVRRGTCCRLRC